MINWLKLLITMLVPNYDNLQNDYQITHGTDYRVQTLNSEHLNNQVTDYNYY